MKIELQVHVVVVGAGYFSQFHYMGWRNIEGVDIVALATRHQTKAWAMAERFGIRHAFADVERMLDEMTPDLIDVVTPPETHRTGFAIERHVPLICQKHFWTALSEAVEVTELTEHAGVPLMVHEDFRWEPRYREARRLINAGQLGVLHDVAFPFRPGDGQGRMPTLIGSRTFETMLRFVVYETVICWIDTFRFLMGDVTAVYAQLQRINPAFKTKTRATSPSSSRIARWKGVLHATA